MFKLEKPITITDKTCRNPNLAEGMDEQDLKRIGLHVSEGYRRDKASREKWETRMDAAFDLALQVVKAKSFPWQGCANVAFPLITIAALQFNARAYPALVPGPSLVQYRVVPESTEGMPEEKTIAIAIKNAGEIARASRIGRHMSEQFMEEDENWEAQHDTLTIVLPIVGSAFKKTYYSSEKGHNVSELVMARDLVMDYWSKSVETTPRKTHRIPVHRNTLWERAHSGQYLDVTKCQWFGVPATIPVPGQTAERQGVVPTEPDEDTPFWLLEQHCLLDLDGDGYAEPYIITVEEESSEVLRIVARWEFPEHVQRMSNGAIARISATEYFTGYVLIPDPEGGVYGLGFGRLLGPLNETVDTLLNQLLDAGTMQTAGGGFLGRGARIRSGATTFAPLEWKRIDAPGDDIRKAIVPLPVNAPSDVLFRLLDLLINYTQRISSTNETVQGENPGQNTPAQTTQTMVEQGQKIYAAIFKRIWRSMKEEFKKAYALNTLYYRGGGIAAEGDYRGDASKVRPVADPHVVSDTMRVMQAQAISQRAYAVPGYDIQAVELNLLRAMKVDSPETFYPGPGKVPPLPNPKVSVEQAKQQTKLAEIQSKERMFLAELMEQRRLNQATILKLEADAAKAIAEAHGVEAGHQIAAFEAAIGALKTHNEAIQGRIDTMLKAMASADINQENGNEHTLSGGMGRVAAPAGNSSPHGIPGGQAPSTA